MTESTLKEHAKKISALVDKINVFQENYHELREDQIMIKGDINHIKSRMDNGLSKTITELDKKFDELSSVINNKIMPVIYDSEYNIGLLKKGTFMVVMSIIVIGVGRIAWSFIGKVIGL